MLARWIATVAALLLACAHASAHVRSERAADLGTFAAGTEHALEIERSAVNASPGELARNPKTAPPARASLENPASGENALLTHCHAWENWSPLRKCASGVHKYLYANGNPGSYTDPDGHCSVQLELGPCDLRRNAAYLSGEAAATQNRIADIADARLASKKSAAVTGITQSILKNIEGGVRLLADAAYTIPEQMLPDSWDRGSRVRLGGTMVGLTGFVGSPIDTTEGQYVEGLDQAAELRAAGRTFEADTAEWEAHTDLASMAFGAHQLWRAGARYAGRQLDDYAGKLDFDVREIDAQVYADAAPRERVVLEGSGGSPQMAVPGDAGFIGPLAQSWTLVPDGMGAHLVERSSLKNRPELADFDRNDTPRYYPYGTPENAGHAHVRLHRATRSEGVRGASAHFSGAELLDAFGRAYSQPGLAGIRGDLRTPDSSLVVKESVDPSEAYDALLEWFVREKSAK